MCNPYNSPVSAGLLANKTRAYSHAAFTSDGVNGGDGKDSYVDDFV